MRAAVFDAPGLPLRLTEVASPSAGAGEAILRVHSVGICGSDIHATEETGIARRGGILGHEVAGEIVELGPAPHGEWSVGDRVFVISQLSCGTCPACVERDNHRCRDLAFFGALGDDQPDGAYAELLRVRTPDLLPVPDAIPLDVAALVEPLATGLMLVRDAQIGIGDTVAVLGAGPIGLTTARWARFRGARRVIVSEFVTHRLALAERMGATDIVDAGAVDSVKDEVERLLGAAPDIVIECVGRPGVFNQAVDLVRHGGTVIAGGVCMAPDPIDHVLAYTKEPTVRFPATYTRSENEFVMEMIEQGRIDPTPLISHTIPLDELPEAFEALRRPTDQCKVVVNP
ncbi:MAG: alcohol dehydrogenase [Planctomycetaceae bacterium]|nr:alcohol dehydrogenase [Planctomycetaceae bacterium]